MRACALRPPHPPPETHRPAANPRTGEWESLQNFVCFEKPKGLFEDTLPGFLNAHGERASYIHIDNDLYAGAKFVLDALGPRLAEGAVLNFHELVNIVGENVRSSKGAVIPPARECLQETRAIYEFLVGQPNLRLELIPRRILHGQAIAFRVVAQRRHEAG